MTAPSDVLSHRRVLQLAWPILVSMISTTVMTAVDVIYVGWLGTIPLAAIGISASLVYLVSAFGNGLLGGVRVGSAHGTGAGASTRVRAFGWQGVWIAALLGAGALLVIPLGEPVLRLMGASDEIRPLAHVYLTVRVLGAPIEFLVVALTCWFQGRGQTRVPMIASLAANGLNVVLDPFFIFGWGPFPMWGVAGAAATTVLGAAVALVVLVAAARRTLLPVVGPDRQLLREVWAVGAPQGLQYVLDVASYAVFASLLAWAGDVHLAAHVIVVRIVMVVFLPTYALGEATGVFVGQALGANLPARARRALRLARVEALVWMSALALPLLLVPDLLAAPFGPADDVRELLRPVVRLYALFQVVDAVAAVTYGALTGAGDTRFALRVMVLSSWLVKIPVASVLVVGLDLGVTGAWLGIAAEIVFQATLLTLRARGGRWLLRGRELGVAGGGEVLEHLEPGTPAGDGQRPLREAAT